MKRLVVSLLLMFAGVAPVLAQAPPNRSGEVQQLVAGKYAGILNGNDDVRREVLRGICVDLNLLDGGRWGLLIKNDQNGRVPADILVWRPTRTHFDVLTDVTAAWQDDGPIPEAWGWLECVVSTTTPPPVVVVPPPVSQPPSDLLAQIAALRLELATHEAAEAIERDQAEAFRQSVADKWKHFGVFLAKYAPMVVGAIYAGRATAK